ncbi:MAG TPA: nicotinate (nicotinamide) nucleotide adenylyltransferase [Rectinemataceae bacterium]|nr:nicotinate (nicotinamide) nucleotide adenylyltransferase [Rectinemataceae bacterium]
MRLLVFGGTFNPVHLGHLIMAEEVREEFGYDRVLFVPAARSPFKDGSEDPGPDHRLEMLSLACANNPAFAIDARELGRGGASFTIDTIRALVAEGEIEPRPGLLVGDDLVSGLPGWREFDALKRETLIIVARRGGSPGEAPLDPAYRQATNRIIPLSSSEIRFLAAKGSSIRYLVPDSVRAYILDKRLYGTR